MTFLKIATGQLELPATVAGDARPGNEGRLTQQHAIVVDIGGTTPDFGVIKEGFPRESSIPVDICGVRTNFRMGYKQY